MKTIPTNEFVLNVEKLSPIVNAVEIAIAILVNAAANVERRTASVVETATATLANVAVNVERRTAGAVETATAILANVAVNVERRTAGVAIDVADIVVSAINLHVH
ncbi:hypothetical protein R0K05_15995 [Planococcus sp. SIMBA_160]